MKQWNSEEEARNEIKALIGDYYLQYKKNDEVFRPGDRINYASRVFDEKEMQSLADACLDFWLTA
jgi:CDP-6-deoxy-D-xylo-4-hexulose-3-dehydrase